MQDVIDPARIVFDCDLALVTIAAMKSTDGAARKVMERITARQMRRMRPHPGGAAREICETLDVDNDSGDEIEIRINRMRDGGSPTVTHRSGGASLHAGYILRLPPIVLPETMLVALDGRRVGDLVDMTETGFARLADATIKDIINTDHGEPATLVYLNNRKYRIQPIQLG